MSGSRKKHRHTLLLTGLLLLGIAALLILVRTSYEPSVGDQYPFHRDPAEGHRGFPAKNSGTGHAEDEVATHAKRPPPTVQISGIGMLPYDHVVREMNLNEILLKCDLLTDAAYERRLELGIKSVADIYLDEQRELLHMAYEKGLFQTYSRDREAMKSFGRDDLPGGGGLRIVEFGVPGLTLDNIPMLKPFLFKADLFSAMPSENPPLEIEITPVMVEVTDGFRGDPKYVGRKLPMMLVKRAHGTLPPSEYREDFIEFPTQQVVRRSWSLTPFLADPEESEPTLPQVWGGGPFDEPLLEAWRAKYGDEENRDRGDPEGEW